MGVKKNNKKGKKRPSGRSGHLLTSWGDMIFIGGGYSEIGPLNDFWEYHKDQQEWKCVNLPSKESPFPRMMCDGCQFNEEIYLFGGIQQLDEEILIQNDLWKYDIRTKRWILLQSESPISERYNHAIVSISPTRMLVHGGECNGLFSDCWVYDIVARTFTQVPTPLGSSPCPRSSHSCTFIYPYVIIFGGVSNTSICIGETSEDSSPVYLNDLWLLDTSTSINPEEWTWRMLPFEGLAPSPRDMASLVDISELIQRPHSILLYGGYGLSEVELENEEEEISDISPENNANIEPEITTSALETTTASFETKPSEIEDSSALDSEFQSLDIQEDANKTPHQEEKHLETHAAESNVERNNEDEDDEESICETYLGDAWIINIVSGETAEVTLTSPNSKFFSSESGWRGSRFAILHSLGPEHNLELTCFGGFNGREFADHTSMISIGSEL